MDTVANDIYPLLLTTYSHAIHYWHAVPGSSVVGKYIRNSYQNDPFRVILELLLFFFALKYLLSKRYSPRTDTIKFSEREVDELIDEWTPEPLVPGDIDTLSDRRNLEEVNSIPVILSGSGVKVKVEGTNRILVNMSSFDVYSLTNSDRIKDKAILALRKYGVGACNPPGFYGTMDVHMQLEKDIARFLNTEQAILYAQGFSAISSVVPAFCKRGDLVIVDEGVSFALQKGYQISRSRVIFFKHNDINDLENILTTVANEDKRLKRSLYRKFILVEGIYANWGDIAPLPKLVELKEKFKYRLIVEESYSFGILGANGRGITEHFNIPTSKIDMLVASLANSIGASGGFCAGSLPVIEHQRLSAQAYVFSAALPPMLAVAASEGLAYIEKEGAIVLRTLQSNIQAIRTILLQIPYFELLSSPESPLQHLRVARNSLPFDLIGTDASSDYDSSSFTSAGPLSPPRPSVLSLLAGNRNVTRSRTPAKNISEPKDPEGALVERETQFLQDIVRECFDYGVLITRSKYNSEQEYKCPRPSLKIVVPAELSRREAEQTAKIIKSASIKVAQAWTKARK